MTRQRWAAAERGQESGPGRLTRHSFSFGQHYDARNVAFGPLVCHNDDLLDPGAGYPDHPHSDTEIVTWVLSGTLVHTDSLGHRTALTPGSVQVQSAGSGIVHSEVADPASGPTRFVQSWLRPDEWDLPPQRHLGSAPSGTELAGGFHTVVGPDALPVASRGARFLVAAPGAGWRGSLPSAPRVHLFVASGRVEVAGQVLAGGDALRIEDEPGTDLTVLQDAHLLVWAFG